MVVAKGPLNEKSRDVAYDQVVGRPTCCRLPMKLKKKGGGGEAVALQKAHFQHGEPELDGGCSQPLAHDGQRTPRSAGKFLQERFAGNGWSKRSSILCEGGVGDGGARKRVELDANGLLNKLRRFTQIHGTKADR